jgi:phage gpG-like protein
MSLSVDAAGIDAVADDVAELPDRLLGALKQRADTLSQVLLQRIQAKLDGEVLKQRSGRLAASIGVDVAHSASGVQITAGSNGDLPYAAIQEYGGTIPPHDILPDKAKALSFLVNGKRVFAEIVHFPGATLPARSYLRSSLEELAATLQQGLGEDAIDEVLA